MYINRPHWPTQPSTFPPMKLRNYSATELRTYPPTYLGTCIAACLGTFHLPTNLPRYQPTYLLTLPTCA